MRGDVSNRALKFALFFIVSFSLLISEVSAKTVYVRYGGGTNGAGSGDGTSWATALADLQTAIGLCVNGDEIYMTAAINDGFTTYVLPTIFWNKSINIYGSFSYTNPEANPALRARPANARPWEFSNPTVIRHIAWNDVNADKGAVIQPEVFVSLCYMDGFTLMDGGYVTGTFREEQGGAISLETNNGLRNCIITHNKVKFGGGVYISSRAVVDGCLIMNNTAVGGSQDGGGVVVSGDINYRGKLLNSYITNNYAYNNAGGVFFQGNGYMANCVVSNNEALERGGGVWMDQGEIVNGTVVNNKANAGGDNGRGIMSNSSSSKIYNTVLWGNAGNGTSHVTYNNGLPTYSYNAEPSPWGLTNSLAISTANTTGTNPPNFVSPTASAGNISFPNLSYSNVGNWDISSTSALIGVGNNSYNVETTDIQLKTRIVNGTIDIGAYELQTITITPSNIVISNNTKVYNGSGQSPTVTITPSVTYKTEYKVQGAADATYTTTQPINVGVYDVKVTVTQSGYSGSNTGSFTITKATVTGVSLADATYTYDGTERSLNVTGSIPAGTSVIYVNEKRTDAGSNNVTATVSGSNYNDLVLNAILTINQKPLTATASSVTKVYDRSLTAPIPALTLAQGSGANQVVASDWGNVTAAGTSALYTTKTVGTNKEVTVSGVALSGARSANYSIATSVVNNTSTITAAPLTITGVTANNKTYTGTNTATLSGTASIVENIGSDAVTLVASSSTVFQTVNVANGITVTTNYALSGADAANYSLAQPTLSANITPATLTVTFGAVTKEFDGTNAIASVPALVVAGQQNGETVTATGASATYNNENVASGKRVDVTGIVFTSPNNNNYTLASTAFNNLGEITKKDISSTLQVTFNAITKVYDGTSSVAAISTPSGFTLTGLIAGGTDVQVSGYASASFDTKHVGINKTITVNGLTYSGTDVGNYTLPSSTTNTASSITKKAITITVDDNQTKVYDKNSANPAAYTYTATPLAAGDSYVGALSRTVNENVGSYPIIQGSLMPQTSGEASAGANYNITFVGKNFTITQKTLTISGLSAQNKVYDATTTATITGGTLNGVVSGDAVTFSYLANFNTKNVGVAKPITSTFTLTGGAVIANYALTQPAGFVADVTPRELEAVGFSIADRAPIVGDFSATIANWGVLQVVPAPDNGKVSIKQTGVTATFPTDAAGLHDVTLSTLVLEGSEASNYTIKQPSNLKARISNDLPSFDWGTISLNPVYNGSPYPITVTETHSGNPAIIEYDGGSGWVSTPPIDAGTYVVRATSPDNVTYIGSETKTLIISKKPLVAATFADGTKPYDATINVTPQPVLILAGIENRDKLPINIDPVIASGDPAYFDSPLVGARTVTIENITLSGAGSANYTIPSTALNSNWTITKRDITTIPLVITFDPQVKDFDGTTDVLPLGANTPIKITGFIAGDEFTAQAATASYDTQYAGKNKTVTLSGITYSNNAANKYNLPTTLTNANCEIRKVEAINVIGASISFDPQTKVYDGDVTVKNSSGNVYVPPVVVTGLGNVTANITTATAAYEDKRSGENKKITISGITYEGADTINYTLPSQIELSNSSITKRTIDPQFGGIQITFADQIKEYDGTKSVLDGSGTPYVPLLTLLNKIAGDDVTPNGAVAYFDSENVGTRTVTVRGIQLFGVDKDNYVVADTAQNITSSIVPKALGAQAWLSFADQTKVYDGTTNVLPVSVPAITVNGLIGDDVVTATGGLAYYDTKNVGTGKTVTIDNVVKGGADAANYLLPTTVVNTNSEIVQRSGISNPDCRVVLADQTKVFDNTTNVMPDGLNTYLDIQGIVAGDVVVATSTAAYYDNKNVGYGKRVTFEISYSGADAGNYDLPSVIYNDNSSITPLDITTITGASISFANQSKVYDATTVVKDGSGTAYVPAISIVGLPVGVDVKAVGTSASYNSKDAGIGTKEVTIYDIIYSGADSLNFVFPSSIKNSTSTILPRSTTDDASIMVSFANQNKVYDGTTLLTDGINTPIQIDGLLAGDVVTASVTSANYESANVGTTRAILDGVTYGGADAANYSLPTTIFNDASSISRKSVVIRPDDGQTRQYDTPHSELTYTISPSTLPNGTAIALNGSLAWDGINEVGIFKILQGTVDNANNPNYDVQFSSDEVTFQITSGIEILRKWGYVLMVNNEGDRFSSFQWCNENGPIAGATSQFYGNKNKMLCGDFYCEVVFAKDGYKSKSEVRVERVNCNGTKSYALLPNVAEPNGEVKIKDISGFEPMEMIDSPVNNSPYQVSIYTVVGTLVWSQTVSVIDDYAIEVPATKGAYIVKVTQMGEEIITEKFFVK